MCLGDDCNNDGVDRRSFLAGAAATVTTLTLLQGQAANSQTTQPPTRVLDDPTLQHGRVVFKHAGKDTIDGYLARPKAEGVYPGVLVIAGSVITEEYIPNTCAALALAGFVGLAPNVFHPLPATVSLNDNEAINRYLSEHTDLDWVDDLQSAVSYLRTQPFVSKGGMGVVGFCRGGHVAMMFGAQSRDMNAVVAFHPGPVKDGELIRLGSTPVQIHHGTADKSVAVTESQKTEKMLKAQRTPIELFLYEGADHGFLAYTRPSYKPAAAMLAWERAVRFLHKNLK